MVGYRAGGFRAKFVGRSLSCYYSRTLPNASHSTNKKMASKVPSRSLSASVPTESQYPAVLLLYHPCMEEMAKNLAKATDVKALMSNPSVLLQDSKYRSVELWNHVKWGTFKDGWPNIFIDEVQTIAGRDVIFLASFHEPSMVFEQLSLIYSLPRYLVRSFRLILPFFPTGTMERIDTEGQVVTAKCMASLLSIIPFAARGPAQIFIFDIHALQERFYFSDQVIPRLLSAIPLLMRELLDHPDKDNMCIAFPDEGAWKRFHSDFTSVWHTITCTKVRKGDQREVSIKEGNPNGKHVVIVDDLVQTGGTLINCAEVLKTKGAAKISMYVTHGVFPKESWRNFLSGSGKVDVETFWLTNSIPHAMEITKHTPFKLIHLSPVIADSLLGSDLLTCNL